MNNKEDIIKILEVIPKEKRSDYLEAHIKLLRVVMKDKKIRENCSKIKRVFTELEDLVQQLE